MLYILIVGLGNTSYAKARKDTDLTSPRARVFLLAAHDHLRVKR